MTEQDLENFAFILTGLDSLTDEYMHLFTHGSSCGCTPGGCHLRNCSRPGAARARPVKPVQFLWNYEQTNKAVFNQPPPCGMCRHPLPRVACPQWEQSWVLHLTGHPHQCLKQMKNKLENATLHMHYIRGHGFSWKYLLVGLCSLEYKLVYLTWAVLLPKPSLIIL